MIKFFRNNKQKLLSEGKTGKYFKYAIGEIVLVEIKNERTHFVSVLEKKALISNYEEITIA